MPVFTSLSLYYILLTGVDPFTANHGAKHGSDLNVLRAACGNVRSKHDQIRLFTDSNAAQPVVAQELICLVDGGRLDAKLLKAVVMQSKPSFPQNR